MGDAEGPGGPWAAGGHGWGEGSSCGHRVVPAAGAALRSRSPRSFSHSPPRCFVTSLLFVRTQPLSLPPPPHTPPTHFLAALKPSGSERFAVSARPQQRSGAGGAGGSKTAFGPLSFEGHFGDSPRRGWRWGGDVRPQEVFGTAARCGLQCWCWNCLLPSARAPGGGGGEEGPGGATSSPEHCKVVKNPNFCVFTPKCESHAAPGLGAGVRSCRARAGCDPRGDAVVFIGTHCDTPGDTTSMWDRHQPPAETTALMGAPQTSWGH